MNTPNWMGKRAQGLNPTQSAINNRRAYTNRLPSVKQSALKTSIHVTLYVLNGLYLGTFKYIYTAISIDEKRSHVLEGEQRGV